MRLLLGVLTIFFTVRFTKWRNWREYYPTILFMIAVNLTASCITHNQRLWIFCESSFLTTHMISDLFHTFITFPCTVLLYLSHYPRQRTHQVYYTLTWAFLYSWAEFCFACLGLVTYTNGWSLAWSVIFNCVMFPILRVHHSNPLLAWALSITVTIFIWYHFNFSLDMLN